MRLTIEDVSWAESEDEDEDEEERTEADAGADVRVFYPLPPVELWEVRGRRVCWRRSQQLWARWGRRRGFDGGRSSHRQDPGHGVGR